LILESDAPQGVLLWAGRRAPQQAGAAFVFPVARQRKKKMKRNRFLVVIKFMALGLCISFFGSGAIAQNAPWAPQQNIAGVGSAVGPSLAEFGDRLFSAWRGIPGDDGIYWSSFDGHAWAPQQRISGVGSEVGPSLVVFQGRLFAAWRGTPDDDGIYWSSFDGHAWAPQQNIAGVGSSHGPSLAAFGSRLFAAWRGSQGDDGIWYSSKAVP
jgi:hypothetical protein